jgi:hypothetical protein
MSQTIVNLTLPIVTAKINDALRDSPLWSEPPTMATQELHQKLTAYVLSRLPAVYITLESEVACSLDDPTSCYPNEQQRHIDQLIQQGLIALSEQRQSWMSRPTALADASLSPSHWFG